MHCDEAQTQLFDLHEDQLDPSIRSVLEQHIADCQSCRLDLDNTRLMAGIAGAWDEQNPPLWRPATLVAPQPHWWHVPRDWLPVAATALIVAMFATGQFDTGTTDGTAQTLAAAAGINPTLVAQRKDPDQISLGHRPVTHAELRQALAHFQADHVSVAVSEQAYRAANTRTGGPAFESAMHMLRHGQAPSGAELERLMGWPKNSTGAAVPRFQRVGTTPVMAVEPR